MAMNKAGTIKSVLIVLILLLVIVLGVLGLNTAKTYIGGASADTKPINVLATPNDDGKSATITWTSDKSLIGVVEYGTGPAALLLRSPETEATTTHSVVLSPLKSGTSYYFRIRIGEEVFDNNGIPYSFKTKPAEVMATPTTAVVPTIVPVITATQFSNVCNKTTDYNKDGVINTLDYITCLRNLQPTAVSGKCPSNVDYNKDGVINSLDRVKCLQAR